MGMSASQARLIALTARMSDTEYEAQQINQQRLVLSNKMNEIYEALCNMEVPTPPSKIDYMTTQYTGKQGKNSYTAKVNDDGTVTAYEKADGAIVSKTGDQKVSAPANPEQYINTSSKITSDDVTKLEASNYYKVVDEKSPSKETERADFAEGYKEYVSGTVKEHYLEKKVDKEAYTDNDGEFHEEEYHYEDKTRDVTINNMLISEYESKYKNSQETRSATNSDKTVTTVNLYSGFEGVKTDHIYGLKNVSGSEDFDSRYSYQSMDGESISGQDAIKHNKTVDENLKKNYAVKDGNTYKIVKGSELAESGEEGFEITNEDKLKSTIEAIKNGATGLSVGGNPTMSLDAAEAKFGTSGQNLDEFNKALEGLMHVFPNDYQNFTVIVAQDSNGKYSFSFCQTEDLNKSLDTDGVTPVWVPGTGEYDKEIAATAAFDPTTGDITTITPEDGGTPIKMTSEKVTDEYAYEAAMSKYNNEKADYDQEQNRLNKQTSIYQRQDKQLELKLTRLDNERNALNTEIEAVKKVIQDSIDRGFKTFSG